MVRKETGAPADPPDTRPMKRNEASRWLAGFLSALMMLSAAMAAPSAERMSKKAAELELSEQEAPESAVEAELGDQTRAVINVSVANVRATPRHQAELMNQLLLGSPVTLLGRRANWFQVQSPDGYSGWVERQELATMTENRLKDWMTGSQIIITAFHDWIWEQPDPKSVPVSDLASGCILKRLSSSGGWIKVELPDGRIGHIQRQSGTEYDTWKRTARPTPANIERVAKSFLGVPYQWGAASTKATDCSGFTKSVFMLNGVSLLRDARMQATQGKAVELGTSFEKLQKGDLLFFAGNPKKPDDITHVAIYLEKGLFIHASGQVRFNSFDSKSPLFAENRLKTFVAARRVL